LVGKSFGVIDIDFTTTKLFVQLKMGKYSLQMVIFFIFRLDKAKIQEENAEKMKRYNLSLAWDSKKGNISTPLWKSNEILVLPHRQQIKWSIT
jgi:hypothetical protein